MTLYRMTKKKTEQEKTVTAILSALTVVPDSGYELKKVTVNPQVHSTTNTPTTRGTVDLGENHNYRYINTNSVPNSINETLLWENSSPTSNFAAQNVTLSQDITNFDYIKIIARWHTGTDAEFETTISVTSLVEGMSDSNYSYVDGLYGSYNGANSRHRGYYAASNTELHFNTTYQNTSQAQTTSTAYLIPIAIYGLK